MPGRRLQLSRLSLRMRKALRRLLRVRDAFGGLLRLRRELRRLRHAAPQGGAAQAPEDDAAAAALDEMRPVTEAELQEAA